MDNILIYATDGEIFEICAVIAKTKTNIGASDQLPLLAFSIFAHISLWISVYILAISAQISNISPSVA